MRSLVLCLVTVSVLGLLILKVEGNSPMVCEPCKPEECSAVACTCGTFKDECNCCDVCRKCPRDACSLMMGDVCQEGYGCAHAPGMSYVERHNNPGTCVPLADVPAEEE